LRLVLLPLVAVVAVATSPQVPSVSVGQEIQTLTDLGLQEVLVNQERVLELVEVVV
jgi:hypothetical protein